MFDRLSAGTDDFAFVLSDICGERIEAVQTIRPDHGLGAQHSHTLGSDLRNCEGGQWVETYEQRMTFLVGLHSRDK